MKKQELLQLIQDGREIEFEYRGKRYSITYYNDGRPKYISFCEFYQEPIDVEAPEKVLDILIENIRLERIFEYLPDTAIDIF